MSANNLIAVFSVETIMCMMKSLIASVVVTLVLFSGLYSKGSASSLVTASEADTPSNHELAAAYNEFRYRRICPNDEGCDKVRWQKEPYVGHAAAEKCIRSPRSDTFRCQFIVFESRGLPPVDGHPSTGIEEIIHNCDGFFSRKQKQWRLLSLAGSCYPFGEEPSH